MLFCLQFESNVSQFASWVLWLSLKYLHPVVLTILICPRIIILIYEGIENQNMEWGFNFQNSLSFFVLHRYQKIKIEAVMIFSSTTFYDALIFFITRFSVHLWKYFRYHVCLKFEIIIAFYITYNDSLLSSRTMTDNESDVYVSAAMHHYRNWMTGLFSMSICDENI